MMEFGELVRAVLIPVVVVGGFFYFAFLWFQLMEELREHTKRLGQIDHTLNNQSRTLESIETQAERIANASRGY